MRIFGAYTLFGIALGLAAGLLGQVAMAANKSLPRGYTIPTIDLARQTHRQVVVDREKGQYLGHPTTVLLEDGQTLLIVYPKGHGKGGIVYKRSTDGGKTWGERLPTPASWATSREV
ncbi:MAG TPA: sialidase family protein, partial [Verrucomicrobiota bacterium]|nr:sialidase family protein [Verrucomicrobiota bacterium]